jgi:hypothetical protein
MTDRPTPDRFDRDLAAVLAEPATGDPPLRLRTGLATLPVQRTTRWRPGFGLPMRGVALIGVAALLLAAVAGPALLGGVGGGAPRVVKYAWTTSTVVFEAGDITISAGGRTFIPPTSPAVHSDPGNPTYTTLETSWSDSGREMRLFVYFQSDGTRWWSEELRTYDGLDPADWITYRGRFFDRPVGQAFDGNLDLGSSEAAHEGVTGTVRITGLHLEAFHAGGAPEATSQSGPVSTTVEASAVAVPPTPDPSAAPSGGPIVEPVPTPAPAIPATATPAPSAAPSSAPPATPIRAMPQPTPAWSPTALALPDGRITALQSLSLTTDHRSLAVRFVGGKPYDAADPCSTDYRGLAVEHDGRLQVAVVEVVGLRPTGSVLCDAIGYARELTIALDGPFGGNTVYDMAGYTHFLAPPPGLVKVDGLPKGWSLRTSRDVEESPTGRWQRIWSPVADPTKDDPQVSLIQAIGGPSDVSGGNETRQVTINGLPATLWRFAPTGELLLTWQFGADGMALVANERDFTQEQFLALAASITAGQG